MIKKITILSTFFILFLTVGELKGQDTSLGAGISSDSAFAIQANICRLNDGITMERYEALNARYFKWAEKNEYVINTIKIRLTNSEQKRPKFTLKIKLRKNVIK